MWALPALLAALLLPASVQAQSAVSAADYLAGVQRPDGGWSSAEVRDLQATTEAIRALQGVGLEPAARAAAADYLESLLPADTDDGSRRVGVLAAEGRDVSGLIAALRLAAHPDGGWGLTSRFAADPLDTALVLRAAAPSLIGDDVLIPALSRLLSVQAADGGWPCVERGDSEIFCTSLALLALTPYRSRFFLDPPIQAGADFLRGSLNPSGSFGPSGPDEVIQTALASMALAAVPSFGSEVATVIGYLGGQQAADGSWNGEPYSTALALLALQNLSLVPYCGDGAINQPAEACDGGDLGGLTCEAVGLGAGTLACAADCRLDTSGCSAPPICGDDLRNQPFEICDGTDLAGQTCQSQGFAVGTLACAADCLSFDVSGCVATPSCGDGVINQPSESCDLSDLGGVTCEGLGLGGGQLACNTDCAFDTSDCDSASFEIDNRGREFFVGFLRPFSTGALAAVHLTADVPTEVTVQYPIDSPSFSQTVTVDPGVVTVVPLPDGVFTGWTSGQVRNNAVRLAGDDDFVVYLVNRQSATSDAAMALPTDAIGTEYVITTARGSQRVSSDRSEFLVVALRDATTVTITPTTTIRNGAVNAPPGVPFTLTLNRGEGFRAEATAARTDLTGSRVEADRPVAVVNGNVCTNVPTTVTFCDHIFEVAHPVGSWGVSALVTNLPNRPGGSVYRVVAAEDDTSVFLDGALQTTLSADGLLETGPLAGSHVFSADRPIFVTQFMTGDSSPGAVDGDPAMANMIPPDQYLESYTFSTVGAGQFSRHFLTLTAPESSLADLLLDGAPVDPGLFSPIGSTGFSSAVLPIAEGSHTTSSPVPHGITVEGINAFDSYIYPGGARLELINPICGDGVVNLAFEQCDGQDFQGLNCSSFGFSGGFLQCTSACVIDTTACSGVGAEDEDEDGYPASDDCDDLDPNVNPGMEEIPGNGIDDDCNPATPDQVPTGAVECSLVADQVTYSAADVVRLESGVRNLDGLFSLIGLSAELTIYDDLGGAVFQEVRNLAPVPPGARVQLEFIASAAARPPGAYDAELRILSAGDEAAVCAVGFAIGDSAPTGTGLVGSLEFDPATVNAGDTSDAVFSVGNLGNSGLEDLALRIVLLDPETGDLVAEAGVPVGTLAAGGSSAGRSTFDTDGLAIQSYLGVLVAVLASGDELTLDQALLIVVNVPPDCSGAAADEEELWPPNHKFESVGVVGVVDPDGDPVTLTIVGVTQDEPTDSTGDGSTCPDAGALGDSTVALRRERSGTGDGRVYHVRFRADDGRGGVCESEVVVCVPHNRNDVCVDQGPLFGSTICL